MKTAMIKKALLVFMVVCLFSSVTNAQSNDDFRLRTGIEVTKDFRKGFQLGFQYQYRRINNWSQFQGSYFAISPSYKINDYLETNIDFRYATSPIWDRFRFAYYLNSKYKIKKIEYSFRAGYLYEYYLQEISEIGQFLPTNNIRLRFQAERKVINKVKAQMSIGPVYAIESGGLNFRQFRNTASLSWEFKKDQKISVEYMWQPNFSPQYLYSNHTLLLNCALYIPKLKKKSTNVKK
jgi:Protein of unknown function (DUF2490)